jgi:hypothetical protein
MRPACNRIRSSRPGPTPTALRNAENPQELEVALLVLMAQYALVSTPRGSYLAGTSFKSVTEESDAYDAVGAATPAWRAVLDEASGDTYYWDPASGATCWDPPVAAIPGEDERFLLGLGAAEYSFATSSVEAGGPNDEIQSSTTSLNSSTAPAITSQGFDQARRAQQLSFNVHHTASGATPIC